MGSRSAIAEVEYENAIQKAKRKPHGARRESSWRVSIFPLEPDLILSNLVTYRLLFLMAKSESNLTAHGII
jgi:hypothetical protein